MAICLILIPHLFPLFSSFPSVSPVTSFLTARVTLHENVTHVTAAFLSSVMPDGEEENIPPFSHSARHTVYGSRGNHTRRPTDMYIHISAPTPSPHLAVAALWRGATVHAAVDAAVPAVYELNLKCFL